MVKLAEMTPEEAVAYIEHVKDISAHHTKRAYGADIGEARLKSAKEIDDVLADENARHCFYNVIGDENMDVAPVGQMWFSLENEDGKDVAYLYMINIDPAQQGKGYGKQAMLALQDLVSSDYQASFIYLFVHDFNERARHVYEDMGYEEVEKKRVDDKVVSAKMMKKV